MKYRPSKRVLWLSIPLIPAVLMCGGLWLAGQPDAEALATRGAKPPPKKHFSLLSADLWSRSGDAGEWLGDGFDALVAWEYNPWRNEWKRDRPGFGGRLRRLEESNRPEDKAELERLRKLGREWYERIVARYPELAIGEDRKIPREQNGFLQWHELLARVRKEQGDSLFSTALPADLMNHLRKQTEPDVAAMKAWVEANRARIDEIRAIGLLPDHSVAGVTEEQRMTGAIIRTREAVSALLLDARAAAADGDSARAIESIRAANGLANHLSDIGSPSLLDMLLGANLRLQMQNYVLTNLLPAMSGGQVDLAAWESALNPTLRTPSDLAKTQRAEWALWMSQGILPTLSDSADPATPRDGDYLAEAYTVYVENLARQTEGASLKDFADLPTPTLSMDQLSRRSRELAEEMALARGREVRAIFLRYQESTGLTQAAFAIMSGQAVPTDPIYGLPYKWDPVKRELSLPDVPHERKYKLKPVKVPKL